jgi:iron(III) transport system ATP-binding protein
MSSPKAPSDVVLRLRNVSKRHGQTEALRDVSLDLRHGEIVALLGPSGSGKSTLLAAVAGLVSVDSGEIELGDRVVSSAGNHVPPHERRVGLVFQDHALFPHKTVADNVGFGLRALPRRDRAARVAEMLELVRLGDKARRFPHELSGGESQRVALARALAPSPDVVLLDEPFASLDPTLRAEVRDEVRGLLGNVGAAALLVSHDIEDAVELGHRLAVLHAGRLAQVDTAERLFLAPADEHVAELFAAFSAVPLTDVTGDGSVHATLSPLSADVVFDWPDGPVALVRRRRTR